MSDFVRGEKVTVEDFVKIEKKEIGYDIWLEAPVQQCSLIRFTAIFMGIKQVRVKVYAGDTLIFSEMMVPVAMVSYDSPHTDEYQEPNMALLEDLGHGEAARRNQP